MKVHQFFIGFGPRLWSFRRGDTEYGVKAIPLGGFVKIAGMNPFEEVPPEDVPRVFKAKPAWQRAIVLAAGSFTHFLLGFVILAGVLMAAGSGEPCTPSRPTGCSEPTLTIAEVQPGSAAAAAGLKPGDEMRAVEGLRAGTWDDVVQAIRARPGQTTEIVVARGGEELTFEVALAAKRPSGEKEGYLGVGPRFVGVPARPATAIARAGRDVAVGAKLSLVAFGKLFTPASLSEIFAQVTGRTERDSGGPATIIGITNQAGSLAGSQDWAGFFLLIAGFNVFIGVANLVPLPPLDGGHLAILAYEKITRREVDLRKLIPITVAVIAVLGSLFFMLLYLDIVSPLPTG